jgi:hypothetical protein
LPGVGWAGFDDLWRRPGMAEEIVSAVEARAMWSRYGL